MIHRRGLASIGLSVALVACGAGGSDPSFWQPGDDIGGTRHDFSTAAPGAAGAGQPGQAPTGTGNPIPGIGGSGVVDPGSGAPGAGGYTGASGSPTSFGGTDPGAGGAPVDTGAGGAVVVAGPPPPVGNSGPCSFTFNATTSTANGRFAPKNVGALWIEDSAGKFVKSLEVWGAVRLSNLTAWTSVSGTTTDAITSATHSNHGPHSDHWDCTDVSKAPVPNGAYQACVSFAEDDAFPFFGPAPHVACTPFNKGSGPFTTSPPDQANFKSMQLIMQ